MAVLYLTGLAFACFLALLLFFKSGRSQADHILLGWMVLIAVHILLSHGLFSGWALEYPHMLGLTFPLPLLHGVLLYSYTRSVTGERAIRPGFIGLQLLPAIVVVLLALPFYVLPEAEKARVFRSGGKGFEWFGDVSVLLIVTSGLLYSALSIKTIRRHRARLVQQFSNNDRKLLRWLESMSIALGLIWLSVLFADDRVVFAGVSFFVMFTGFMGINQVPVFYSELQHQPPVPAAGLYTGQAGVVPVPETAAGTRGDTGVATVRSISAAVPGEVQAASLERLETVMKKVGFLMEKVALYEEPELTLGELAAKAGVSANVLSQAINTVAGKTFYQYVNDYRIEAFIQAASLPENRKYTLIALAYACGFHSKTTFHKYFRLKTGKTPTDYFNS
ncbi:MAG: hypothetical protein ABS46_01150 [Cytophagaceae bacterium SCN 52-12]|nr:MAG: hypothetical protein ABS46_01150 [Cytophagaceae bacterium SCN 52-12]